jgi:hypothetical protein
LWVFVDLSLVGFRRLLFPGRPGEQAYGCVVGRKEEFFTPFGFETVRL